MIQWFRSAKLIAENLDTVGGPADFIHLSCKVRVRDTEIQI